MQQGYFTYPKLVCINYATGLQPSSVVLACDKTSTISYSMFFKASLFKTCDYSNIILIRKLC